MKDNDYEIVKDDNGEEDRDVSSSLLASSRLLSARSKDGGEMAKRIKWSRNREGLSAAGDADENILLFVLFQVTFGTSLAPMNNHSVDLSYCYVSRRVRFPKASLGNPTLSSEDVTEVE